MGFHSSTAGCPGLIEAVAATVLLLAIGWRSRRWRLSGCRGAARGSRRGHWTHWMSTWKGCRIIRSPGAVDMGRALGPGRRGRGRRLEQRPLVATGRVIRRGAAVCAQRRAGTESMGRLSPDGADRLEPTDGGPVAGRNRPGDRHRDAAEPHRADPWRTRACDYPERRSHFKHRRSWSTCRRRGSPATRHRDCPP